MKLRAKLSLLLLLWATSFWLTAQAQESEPATAVVVKPRLLIGPRTTFVLTEATEQVFRVPHVGQTVLLRRDEVTDFTVEGDPSATPVQRKLSVKLTINRYQVKTTQNGNIVVAIDTSRPRNETIGLVRPEIIYGFVRKEFEATLESDGRLNLGNLLLDNYLRSAKPPLSSTELEIVKPMYENFAVSLSLFPELPSREVFKVGETFSIDRRGTRGVIQWIGRSTVTILGAAAGTKGDEIVFLEDGQGDVQLKFQSLPNDAKVSTESSRTEYVYSASRAMFVRRSSSEVSTIVVSDASGQYKIFSTGRTQTSLTAK